MTLKFDTPHATDLPFSRCDPRWKLAALLIAMCACVLLRNVWLVAAATSCAIVLVFVVQLPWKWYRGRLGAILPFLILMVILLALGFEERADSPGRWRIVVSTAGLELALTAGLKAVALVSLLCAILGTTPFQDVLKAARALRMPGLLVQLILLSYRYVFLLMSEWTRMRLALRVRGFRNRASRHSYRTIGNVAGTLFIRSHERAERAGHAMRCRGFTGQFHSLHDFSTSAPDLGWFLAIVGPALALYGVDLWLS